MIQLSGHLTVPAGHARRTALSVRGAPVGWWMPPDHDPGAAHRDGDEGVEAQGHHRGPARRRPSQDDHTILTPLQVPSPTLAPRVEEAETPPGPRIAPMDLLACTQLARQAGEPEVSFGIRAPVRPRKDMINGE
jgi:hypothetical protein